MKSMYSPSVEKDKFTFSHFTQKIKLICNLLMSVCITVSTVPFISTDDISRELLS